jgi:hypothetical protein
MTTELLENTEIKEDATATPEPVDTREHLEAQLDELLRFRQEKIPSEGITLCPACMTHVEVSANVCPNCDSNIAANNALVRESLRRLEEIEARLDGEHTRQHRRSSFWGRLKAVFSPPDEEAAGAAATDSGPRFLDGVDKGDSIVVLERLGPWCRVKTPDNRTGWIYSAPSDE